MMSMLEFNKTKMRRNLRHAKKHCLVWEEGVLTCRKRNPSLGMFFHRGLDTVWRISRVLNIFWPSGCALGPKNIQNSLDPSNSISTSVKKHSAWRIFFSACRDSSSQTKNIYSSFLLTNKWCEMMHQLTISTYSSRRNHRVYGKDITLFLSKSFQSTED